MCAVRKKCRSLKKINFKEFLCNLHQTRKTKLFEKVNKTLKDDENNDEVNKIATREK